ncbi:MAG TPA: bifunctional 4-hydroxy-2-oxoglutarate aldolase/2-dehydro-3-deoxy-phosphogluconate aldolase [Anaerolineales bacterium]|nr:bifunctional 4-hydroxy-2-oxoglutarate aldolase/2-dehydro-3-deoxy-phosphogluconate aldolase [Anaerolineales bacterium]
MTNSIFDSFYNIGIIPVLEIDSAERAVPLAESLLAGGLPIAEVTLRTDAALESIGVIAREVSGVIVGAGTVIHWKQAQAAREAGAQFLVSPGMVEEVIIWAQENRVPILPGAATPTEMIRAIHLGLDLLKFFPAESIGGLNAIQAMSDPFPQLRFIPSGGIRLKNAAQYLQSEKIHAVGGSWMSKRQMIADGRFDEITRLAQEASELVKQIRSTQTSCRSGRSGAGDLLPVE